MTNRILANISAIFMVFIIPISLVWSYNVEWAEELAIIPVLAGLGCFAITVGVSSWFLWLGMRIRQAQKLPQSSKVKMIGLAVVAYLIYVAILLIGKFNLFSGLIVNLGYYFSEMLAFRIPVLLYGLVFMVLGMFLRGKEIKLSGRKAWGCCVASALLYLGCCIVGEVVYDRVDEYHIWHALVNAVSVFPLIGLMLSIYGLAGKDCKECRWQGLVGFLEYLCPSVIFVYVLKIYASPIFVLLYLLVMWFIYKKFRS